MDTKTKEDFDQICRKANSDTDLVQAAVQHQYLAVQAIDKEAFDEAIHNGKIASALFERLCSSTTASADQRQSAGLACIQTHLCLAVAERRGGNPDQASATLDSAERRLDTIRDAVFKPREAKGMRRLIPLMNKPKHDQELIADWMRTKAAVLMNRGTLQNTQGQAKEALQTWRKCELHLFDEYVKEIGPEHDLEATGKVFNLWENIMTAALDVGDQDRAAEVTGNAVKLYSYWMMKKKDHPMVVNEAFGMFIGAVADLTSQQRALLNASLPDSLVEIIDSIIDD